MEKLGIIYCYKNRVNGKCYIGQTINEKKRFRDHRLASIELSCSCFHRAIKKYGFDNFEYSVLHYGKTKEELNKLEAEEIQNRNTLSPFGYNLKTGGRSCMQHPDTIKRIRDTNSAKWKNPLFVQEKLSVFKSQKYSDMLKSRISSFPKEKRIEWAKKAQETRRKNYAPIKAKNERVREVLSFILSAERKRVHSTKEYKDYIRSTRQSGSKKIHISACVPIFCITNKQFYLSATQASKKLGIDQGAISKIIRGDGRSTGGYYFRKATEEESVRIKAEYSCI